MSSRANSSTRSCAIAVFVLLVAVIAAAQAPNADLVVNTITFTANPKFAIVTTPDPGNGAFNWTLATYSPQECGAPNDVLRNGFNAGAGGGKMEIQGQGSVYRALESNFCINGRRYFEVYDEYFSPDGQVTFRPIGYNIDKGSNTAMVEITMDGFSVIDRPTGRLLWFISSPNNSTGFLYGHALYGQTGGNNSPTTWGINGATGSATFGSLQVNGAINSNGPISGNGPVCYGGGICDFARSGPPPNTVCQTGSTYRRTDGNKGSTFYVCENGSWFAK